MSNASAPLENLISVGNKVPHLVSLAGIALAFLPSLLAVVYLSSILSPSTEGPLFDAQVDHALEQRTTLIEVEVAAITSGLERALSDRFNPQNPEAIVSLIPGGTKLQVIPLSDMGVASLDPTDYGLTSLVLLDSVRKTFESGSSRLEIIKSEEVPKLVAVGRFNTASNQGVVIVTLDESILARWVSKAPIGDFALWQIIADSPSIQINPVGNASVSKGTATRSRPVNATPYVLGLVVDTSKMPEPPALPHFFWPLIIGGLIASYWVMFVRRGTDLKGDVKSILATVDSRETVALKNAELSPLASALRELAANNRHRIRGSDVAAEQTKVREDQLETLKEAEFVETQVADPIAKEWSICNGSWVELTPTERQTGEQDALKKMALGIAGLTARSSIQSFVVSSLGGEAEAQAKSLFIKALLMEGVDVIDLGSVPPPVTHMATHNGTSSGAALMIQRNTRGVLTVGAIYNRQWASERFWRKVTALSNERTTTASNGRSIKLELIDDYYDRLAGDMAMAEKLQVNVLCDNPVTLAIAEKSLQKASCEVNAIRLDPGFTLQKAQSLVTDRQASLSFVFDSVASRVTVFDESATRVRDDHVFMVLSQDALARQPGGDVIVGPKSSRAMSSFITSCGGASKIADATPHALQRAMTASGAVIGGDCDGTLYLRDRWFGSDDAIYAAARLVEIVSNEGALTKLAAALPETSLNILPLSDDSTLHAALFALLADKANFAGARVLQENGIRVDFADSWVHVDDVASTGAPTLRIEGDDVHCRIQLEALIASLVSHKHPELQISFPTATMTTSRSA